jgi:isoleucyl-tRNA synthetase
LSNWYVRLCRRRFWKNDDPSDKLAAYQTLYTCLETVSILASPIAPFFMDQLFQDLNAVSGNHQEESVHLANFPKSNESVIDKRLESQMELAQKSCSLVLGLRKKHMLRVRQPLQKIMIPVLNQDIADQLMHVKELILSEVNVKELELLTDGAGMLVKSIKPNFKTIGPKYGKQMKSIAGIVANFTQEDIALVEQNLGWTGEIDGTTIELDMVDFEINAQDIPGWLVASEGGITVALDITLSPELKAEGIAREVVNRVQNMRKDAGFEVTDRIVVRIQTTDVITDAIKQFEQYICTEVLANSIAFTMLEKGQQEAIEADGDTVFNITKSN